jgi:hypothetical protein
MRISTRTKIGSAILAVGAIGSGITLAGGAAASASGTTTETVTQVNTMTSAKCYREIRTEVRYYSHSAGHGWKRLPAPARTVSISTHCYVR